MTDGAHGHHHDRDVGRFDRWGARYDRSVFQPVFFKPVHRELLTVLAAAPGERILEVGCGTGNLTMQIARASGSVTVGVDPAAAMIRAAGRKASALSGARFATGIAEALPFADATFDAAVTAISVHHWVSARAGLAEMARVVRPGGRAVVGDVQALGPVLSGLRAIGRVDRDHHTGWAATDLGDMLHRGGFEQVRARTIKAMGAGVVILTAVRAQT